MKIMVFDVPAESGGALSVLHDFYNEFSNDKSNEYIFVVSKPLLMDTDNIKVLRFPWIKKSWFHRLFFDNFIAPNLILEYEVNEVLSLQNIIVPHTNVYQTNYVHNSLPFIEYKFSITKNSILWFYQNIISRSIFKSITRANKVIVQTQWMKNACLKKLKVDPLKIEVMPPKIKVEVKEYFNPSKESLSTFFYPASAIEFKNHSVLIDACIKLKIAGIENYKVILTLNGDENKYIKNLFNITKEKALPVFFIGSISREKVFDYYNKSVLIFPSYIESSPLPLTEAKVHNTPIIVSDCPFAHEILDEYGKVKYFDPFNSNKLLEKMKSSIKKSESINL